MEGIGFILGVAGAAIFVLATVIFVFRYGPTWINAHYSDVKVGMFELLGIDLRGVNSKTIVDAMIRATQAGLPISRDKLEAHYLAGGEVITLTSALIEAEKADIDLNFQKAAAIDLAGRDVFEAVQISVNPKVIECPDPRTGEETVAAIAQDGIQVKAKARVTVRADINKLVGGAKEETIIARVGEGIVTSIGSAESHTEVLENPDRITQEVLNKGLDAGTAFHILSIDIADIDVGKNIGAKLQTDQAEADKKVAKAKAEERRAMARAREQEMQAQVKAKEADFVLASANKYLSLANAFADGDLPPLPGGGGDNGSNGDGGNISPSDLGGGKEQVVKSEVDTEEVTSGDYSSGTGTATKTRTSESTATETAPTESRKESSASSAENQQQSSHEGDGEASETETDQTGSPRTEQENSEVREKIQNWLKEHPDALKTFDENENRKIEGGKFKQAIDTIMTWLEKTESSGEEWHYEQDGEEHGPVSWDQLKEVGNENSSVLINYSSSEYWVPFEALQMALSE